MNSCFGRIVKIPIRYIPKSLLGMLAYQKFMGHCTVFRDTLYETFTELLKTLPLCTALEFHMTMLYKSLHFTLYSSQHFELRSFLICAFCRHVSGAHLQLMELRWKLTKMWNKYCGISTMQRNLSGKTHSSVVIRMCMRMHLMHEMWSSGLFDPAWHGVYGCPVNVAEQIQVLFWVKHLGVLKNTALVGRAWCTYVKEEVLSIVAYVRGRVFDEAIASVSVWGYVMKPLTDDAGQLLHCRNRQGENKRKTMW